MDPYANGLIKKNPYYKKTDIEGVCVVVLDGKVEKRGLELIKPISRAVLKNQIHEFILTAEEAGPGDRVESIAYVAFVEISGGGVIVAGDEVCIEDRVIGKIAGYDETHMPNHLNIVFRSAKSETGRELGISLGDRFVIRKMG